jgi:DNA-binding transcriptional LysR family regulator
VPLDSRHFDLKLEGGEADLALGAFPDAPPGLRRQRLYADGYVGVARRGHPARGALATAAGFAAARHVIVAASETGHEAHRMAQHAVEAAVAPDAVLLRVPSFIAAAHIAAHGDGVATIPAKLAQALAGPLGLAVFRPPVPLPPIAIAQFWPERQHRDPGHRWLRAACFALFGRGRGR